MIYALTTSWPQSLTFSPFFNVQTTEQLTSPNCDIILITLTVILFGEQFGPWGYLTVWRHCWLPKLMGCYWHLLDRDQRCC